MMLMIKNFGSNPKMSCRTITDVVIIMGFLYLNSFSFINQQQPLDGEQKLFLGVCKSDNFTFNFSGGIPQ